MEQRRLILHDNPVRRLGEEHRPANFALAADECARLRGELLCGAFGPEAEPSKELELYNLNVIEAFFRQKERT